MKWLSPSLLLSAVLAGFAQAEEPPPTARAIMQNVEARDLGENMTAQIEMTLTDARGRTRERKLESFSRNRDDLRETRMLFTFPPNLFRTGFLSWDRRRDTEPDEQWLYLSAFGKSKRIAARDKSKRFMGTDFSYYDLTLLNTERFAYNLLGEDEWRGERVWRIASVPVSEEVVVETGYRRSVLWVRADPYLIVRAEHELSDGDRTKVFEARHLEEIDGIWVVTESVMKTYEKGELDHQTVLKISEVAFHQELEDSMFTVRGLEKGLRLLRDLTHLDFQQKGQDKEVGE